MDMTSNTSNSSAAASAPHNHQQVPFDDQLLALIRPFLLATSLPYTDRSMLVNFCCVRFFFNR
jgi:hypothetical protein